MVKTSLSVKIKGGRGSQLPMAPWAVHEIPILPAPTKMRTVFSVILFRSGGGCYGTPRSYGIPIHL